MSYTCNLKKYFDNLWHVALLIVVTCLFAFPTRADELERVLATLDQAIDSADVYTAHRQELINQLMRDRRQAGTDMNAVLAINERLAGEYKSFICDSTTKYYNENIALARALGDTRVENNTKMRLSYHLASSGIYEAALDLLRSIDKRQLANSQLINYYRGFDHVYGEMAYNHLRDVSILRYKELAAAYKDSLNAIIDRDDPRWLEMEETRLRDAGKFVEAMKINDRRLSQCSTGTPQYALVMFQRSLVERAVSDSRQEMVDLGLSAITDIRLATKDHASLWLLAQNLLAAGDLERANRYMRFSWKETNFYNSPLRNLQSAYVMALIEQQYQDQIVESNKDLKLSIWVVSAMALLLVLALVQIARQNKRVNYAHRELQHANDRLHQLNAELNALNASLTDANARLSESNSIKDAYISRLLKLCSEYIDRMDKFRVTLNKKIIAGKTTEALAMTRSTTVSDEALDKLYENFDAAFLHIFPDFVERFNDLLIDSERIQPKSDEMLNTELRIFALIRLGFSDSSQIAEFLRYSVNTIYNYRAKVKSKAKVDRQDFEEMVMRIH